MSRLRDIPETCPIYEEARQNAEYLVNELHGILNKDHSETQYIVEQTEVLLECVDRCREIAGDLRDMCIERGEKIEQLENELEGLR